MAPLYGRLTGEHHRKTVTRRAFYDVQSRLETWDGEIRTVLKRDGSYYVYTGAKGDARNLIATGNVNYGEVGHHEPSVWRMDA
jgi:hypothetical protein